MEAKASVNTVRIAARKVRLVVDLVRGKSVGEAYAILRGTPRGASLVIEKLLKSAVANADHNNQLDQNKLFIKEIFVGEGKTLKRMQPRSQGRGFAILKRTSHVWITVAERE
ncbi:MAG: 50S ribosomal protein L22 [Candidatus Izemoplasmatales bacterium]|nr:50S ribosomal protein L22 [bacterium]MDZ4197161.1 50S ribosomal protein L22 [Candidatus Izemoplasmatales bacterium]